jgi:hypothetical protein
LITDIHGDHMDPASIQEISKGDTEKTHEGNADEMPAGINGRRASRKP